MHGLERRPIHFLTLGLLFSGALTNCNCETEAFIPGVTYDPAPYVKAGEAPGTELVFGDVAVNSEKKLGIRVVSNGGAAVNVVAANLVTTSGDGTWKIEVSPDLDLPGLTPGRTSTIAVTFRPCPAAWNGNVLREPFDYNTCPGESQAGDLNITDNTPDGAASLGLSGRPVQPPVASVWCPVADNCGDPNPQFRRCNGITFGAVSSNEPPCDLVMEIRNDWRNNKPVGDLEIQNIEVLVQDYCCGDPGPILEANEVGFTLEELDGDVLVPDPAKPFVVQITPGDTTGSNQFKFIFNGSRTGLWRGQASAMTGLRLYTNDPDQRVISVPLTAQGSAPQLQCSKNQHNFGPVEQGTTSTTSITCRNAGDADLTISNIGIESGNPEFTVESDRGSLSNITLALFEQIILNVGYTPGNTGVDSELLVITSNDPLTPRTEITLRGGAVPELEVQPSDSLSFPLPTMGNPPFPPQTQPLTMSNVGYGDLNITRLEIRGPDGTLTHPSVDDFTMSECGGANPCDLNLRLCAPGTAGCTTNYTKQLDIIYDNNDISQIDLAELHISSDDPSDPEHIVVLEAEDEPCLFPTGAINVTSPPPSCVGEVVMVDASMSNPGRPDDTLASCEWFWLFTPCEQPAFNTQNTVTNSFVPGCEGTFILGVRCTNSCGSTSQTPGMETILVSDQCN